MPAKVFIKRRAQKTSKPDILKLKIKKFYEFWKDVVRITFLEFCKATSLHGFRQIADIEHQPRDFKLAKLLQKISTWLWIITVLFGFSFGIILMMIVLNRHTITPTITTIENSNFPISNLRFPGVMICNVNVVWKPNTVNITRKLLSHKVSKENINYFLGNLSSMVTFEPVRDDLFKIFDILENTFNYTPNSIMQEVSQPCEHLIHACKWLTRVVDCKLLFRRARSELGHCCAFNYKAVYHSIDRPETPQHELLQRNSPVIQISGAGEDVGIRAFINIDAEQYISPRKYFAGADVVVFDALDYPNRNYISSVCQPGYEIAIGVKPYIIATDENIESFSPNTRNCLFGKENSLLLSQNYGFPTCISECKARTALKLCNCLPFIFPALDYFNNSYNYRVCSLRNLECLSNIKATLFSLKHPKDSYSGPKINNEGLDCNCLPSCSDTNYDTETFYMKRMSTINQNLKGPEVHINSKLADELGLVKVYYKQLSCIKYGRKIFMTWDNLLASIGGIFGLCLGGSVLSLIEIGYYFTITLLQNYLKKQDQIEKENSEFLIKYYRSDFKRPSLFTLYVPTRHNSYQSS